jgi:DNA replication and repair protein RecF
MQIKKVTLTNFRNYAHAEAELWHERNILLGENAQGKSNFIEAIELLAKGRSDRAVSDGDLIRNGAADMNIRLTFEREGRDQSLALSLCKATGHIGKNQAKVAIEKRAQVNGVSSASLRPLSGHLATVSFKNEDLGLLRAGPKFRRDWIDQILINLKPAMQERLARYHKAVSQRNRLLKNLFDKGKVTTSQQDELKVWDDQLAKHGALIISERLDVLNKLLGRGVGYQSILSDQQEALSAAYQLRNSRNRSESEDIERDDGQLSVSQPVHPSPELLIHGGSGHALDAAEIAEMLLRSYKESRYEEISRRQTLYGPHRDDISFLLSGKEATAFASQGQQRSLVLAMKLAELKLVSESLDDSPVLLLDDVLAELDLNRQSLLMSLIRNDMQTIITTTHISGFRPEWLEKAAFIYVKDGSLERQRPDATAEDICNAQVDLG